MKICIVGAGVAGIQVADTLSAASSENECHIFEKTARRRNLVSTHISAHIGLPEDVQL